jgi:hypothetical protein
MRHSAFILLIASVLIVAASVAVAGITVRRAMHAPRPWHTDPQVAAGEWKIEIQTPPCDSVHNLQVIWPKESGAPVTLECDQMPVPTR